MGVTRACCTAEPIEMRNAIGALRIAEVCDHHMNYAETSAN